MDKHKVLEELKRLGFTPSKISKMADIPQGRIYKWYDGSGHPKVDDYNKLLDLYERMKPNPTNDHAFTLNEPTPPYNADEIIIAELKKANAILREQNRTLTDDVEFLKYKLNKALEELDKYKPPEKSNTKNSGARTA
jgi:hypothetical protein